MQHTVNCLIMFPIHSHYFCPLRYSMHFYACYCTQDTVSNCFYNQILTCFINLSMTISTSSLVSARSCSSSIFSSIIPRYQLTNSLLRRPLSSINVKWKNHKRGTDFLSWWCQNMSNSNSCTHEYTLCVCTDLWTAPKLVQVFIGVSFTRGLTFNVLLCCETWATLQYTLVTTAIISSLILLFLNCIQQLSCEC